MNTDSGFSFRLIWLGLLGLVVIYVAALLSEALRIERSIEQQVSVALAATGLGRIVTEVRGRDVLLEGAVSSEAARLEATHIAESVAGVRVVRERVELVARKLPWLRLTEDKLTGRFPSQNDINFIVQSIEYKGIKMENLAKVDAESGAISWLDSIPELLDEVVELTNFSLEIGAGEVAVGGRLMAGSSAAPRVIRLETIIKPYGLKLVNRMATMR